MRLTPGPNLPLLLIPPLLCALLADLWLAGPWMFLLALALTALPALFILREYSLVMPISSALAKNLAYKQFIPPRSSQLF